MFNKERFKAAVFLKGETMEDAAEGVVPFRSAGNGVFDALPPDQAERL